MRRFAVGVTAVVAALASSLGKHGFSWAYSPDRTTIALGGFAVASSSSTRAAPPAFDRAARVPETPRRAYVEMPAGRRRRTLVFSTSKPAGSSRVA
jgi:hypothetical protein